MHVDPGIGLATGARVLIVDDHEDKRTILSCILERHSFTVLEAENGPGAMAMIQENKPDVILLDVLMPGMDGFEVCRRLKKNPATAEIPVLFVTVLDKDRSRIEGLDLGAEDFITWPVNAQELVARVNARLRAYRPLIHLRSVVQEQRRLLEEGRQRDADAESELEKARLIQGRFFPDIFPQRRGIAFAGHYRPSRKIGGDLFDALAVGKHEVALMIADISGHGMPAALLTSVGKVLFRTGAEQCAGPGLLLRWLNTEISSYLASGEFLTMFIGVWNVKSRTFFYSGAGHPPPLMISADGSRVSRLAVGGGVIGILPDSDFPQMSIQLTVGERLVFYTDGIVEAINRDQELFGDERLAEICTRGASFPLQTVVERVFAAVDQFVQGEPQTDDQALLALEVTE